MATKTESKSDAKAVTVKHATGKGKSTKQTIIDLLTKRPMTVPELTKATGASVAHIRTVLYGLDDLQKEEALTRYSLKK